MKPYPAKQPEPSLAMRVALHVTFEVLFLLGVMGVLVLPALWKNGLF